MNPMVELVLKHKKANIRKSEFLMHQQNSTSRILLVYQKIQWVSRKKGYRMYDFNFYIGSTRHIPKSFRSAALSTATQPW